MKIKHDPVSSNITKIKKAEDSVNRNYQLQDVLNLLLNISLEDVPLEMQLERCLDIILYAPFLTLLHKGGIFLFEDETDMLLLKATLTCLSHYRGFVQEFLSADVFAAKQRQVVRYSLPTLWMTDTTATMMG